MTTATTTAGSRRSENAAGQLRRVWDAMSHLPGGRTAISMILGRVAPYTGSIGARVEELSQGRSVVTLRDRARVRNHLRCIHAIALANLAELAGNVALAYSMPSDARFIVAGIHIDYLKKARGDVRAVGSCPPIEGSTRKEYAVDVHIFDSSDVEVATATLRTLVGPVHPASSVDPVEMPRGAAHHV